MKKKSSRVKVSKQKALLLTAVILAVGVFMLFLSILFNPSSSSTPQIADSTVVEKDDNYEYPQSPEPTELAPVKPVTPKPTPESEKPIDRSPEKSIPLIPLEPSTPVTSIEKTKSGKLIFIFDDGGNNARQAIPFLELPFPVTIAVMPGLDYSVETAQLVRNAKKELFLHQPMQAMNLAINPGPGAIFPDMTTGEAAQIVRQNVAEIGPVAGMNNHEGSLITANRDLIGAVLDVCIDDGLMFLDSRTTADTAAPMAALERDMPIWERDIFLDNTQDEAEIRDMLQKGLDIADKQGYVIMIGHVWSPDLPAILLDVYPTLIAQGYTVTTLSALN